MSRNILNFYKVLQEDFENSAILIKIKNLNNLELYSYYKQATIGDNTTLRPSLFNFKDRAKWNAWNNCKGLSKQIAQLIYIQLVHELLN